MTTVDPSPAAPAPVAAHPAPAVRDRLLGLSGIGFLVLLAPVLLVPHPSLDYDVDAPPVASVVTDFFLRHRALEEWQAVMHSLAGVLLVAFGAALAAHVRRVHGPGRPAARLVAAGATGAGAVMVGTMALVAGSIAMAGGIDGRTEWWLYEIGWTEHPTFLYFAPLLLLPACLVLGRARAIPRSLAWTGLLIAVLAVVAMVATLAAGTAFLEFPVFLVLIVWVAVAGVVALTRGVGTRDR